MQELLQAVRYEDYKWKICGDLKVLGLVSGLQGGYKSTPASFACGTVDQTISTFIIRSEHNTLALLF